MQACITNVYIIILLSVLQAKVILPPENLENIEIIHDNKIWIGWEHSEDIDWCRAKSILKASIPDIRKVIEDKKNYPNVFKRIGTTKIITDEIVYMTLDMPFPFAERDYVVKYIQEDSGTDFILRYYAVTHPDVPLVSNYVRLVQASAEWRLTFLDSTKTEITYTWNGELLGNFPDWALTRAWKEQGMEVFKWLREALEK